MEAPFCVYKPTAIQIWYYPQKIITLYDYLPDRIRWAQKD